MSRPRILRLLRLACSAVCVSACVAPIALWVRTRYACDTIHGPILSIGSIVITSRQGGLGFGFHTSIMEPWHSHTWPPDTAPSDKYLSALVIEFYRSPVKDFYVVRFPYWFLIVVFTTLTAALWSSAPWRFSLRTLLIATTLLAVLLGLAVAFQ
jgi:hypothetical protein